LKNNLSLILFLLISFNSFLQNNIDRIIDSEIFKYKSLDSSTFKSFSDKKVVFTDLGFSAAPFSIQFDDTLSQKEVLKYRNNSRSVVGFGISYKWFSLRVSLNLPGYTRPVSKFGESQYLDFGVDFNTKKHYYDIDLHNYKGYAIKNAFQWNDSLSSSQPHAIYQNLSASSLSVNTWRFLNKNIKMSLLRGKTGLYLKEQKSIYIKTTFNYHQVHNSSGIIPEELRYITNSKLESTLIRSYDIGLLPGYVYVNRIKNIQFSGMFGFGPVLQVKGYTYNNQEKAIIGIAPRYDFRFLLGYNVPKYFVNIVSEFDNKSIRFNDLKYRQTYYTLKLIAGIRF
jgi:hypothetical protein